MALKGHWTSVGGYRNKMLRNFKTTQATQTSDVNVST